MSRGTGCGAELEIGFGGSEAFSFGCGQAVQVIAQVAGKWRACFHPFAAARMRKTQLCGMEELPAESRHAEIASLQVRCSAIKPISHQRMFHRGEVHSDLMRSSGV